MKVLFAGLLPPHLGGAAFRDAQLLEMLAHRGHEVIALAPAWPGMDRARARLAPTVELSRFEMGEPYGAPRVFSKPTFRARHERQVASHLSRLVEEHAPDVVAVGGELFLPGIPDLAAALPQPWAILAHGMPPRQQLEELDLLGGMARADLVICCANHLVGSYVKAGIERVVAVPNGIDTGHFRPGEPKSELRRMLGLSPTGTVAFHASNLKPAKRLLDLVASAAAVVKQDAGIVHLIVGTGPDRASLDLACRQHCVDAWVRFIGRIDHARMPDHLALADMVIMPSSREGLSLACLEAMACGKLVIASDIPASREVIRDGETGLLFRMGDVHDLAAKTLLAARDPELRARVGRAARAYVEAHHRVEDMVDRYETTLEDLVEPDRKSVGDRGGDVTRRDGGSAGCSRVDDRAEEPM